MIYYLVALAKSFTKPGPSPRAGEYFYLPITVMDRTYFSTATFDYPLHFCIFASSELNRSFRKSVNSAQPISLVLINFCRSFEI